jgi:hypothetical protein
MSTPRSARPRRVRRGLRDRHRRGRPLLRGGSRAAALVALGVVLGLVAFSGPFAVVPFVIAAAALLAQRPRRASAR